MVKQFLLRGFHPSYVADSEARNEEYFHLRREALLGRSGQKSTSRMFYSEEYSTSGEKLFWVGVGRRVFITFWNY